MTERPPVRLTARVLTIGTVLSVVLFVAGFVLAAARIDDVSRTLGTLGVVALLATPAVGLVATTIELRPLQPRAALLAVIVMGILALATGIALISR